MARVTGLEPATSGVTGRRSNQLSYTRRSFAEAAGYVGPAMLSSAARLPFAPSIDICAANNFREDDKPVARR